MLDVLDRKLRQLHAAVRDLSTADLTTIKPEIVEHESGARYVSVDFSARIAEEELHNKADLLVANIASLKDHLKWWCSAKKVPFEGDSLINSNTAVAIIHDLWNLNKHAEFNKPPRSGKKPKLARITQVMSIGSGSGSEGAAFVTFDLATGRPTSGNVGGGFARLTLHADIVDETGSRIADFVETCSAAAEAWSHALKNAGVPGIP